MINVDKYFDLIHKKFPDDKLTELYYKNPFTLAVAVILSAQATDKKVNEVTHALFEVADDPESMLELGLNGLKEHIKVLSFFNNKAKNIMGLAEKLLDSKGELPREHSALVALPGIGQKTANVIMNVLWGAPTIGVDTHVFRLAHRFDWVDEKDNTPEKVEKKLVALIPEKYHVVVNNLMVMHGRYICKAIKPLCENCPVYELCSCKDKRTIVK